MSSRAICFLFFIIIQPFVSGASVQDLPPEDLSSQRIHRGKLIYCIVHNANVLNRAECVIELENVLGTTSEDDINPLYQCKLFLNHFLSLPQRIDNQQPFTLEYLDTIASQEIECHRKVFPTVQTLADTASEMVHSSLNSLPFLTKPKLPPLPYPCRHTLILEGLPESLCPVGDCQSGPSVRSHVADIARYQMLLQGLCFLKEGLLKPLADYYALTEFMNGDMATHTVLENELFKEQS